MTGWLPAAADLLSTRLQLQAKGWRHYLEFLLDHLYANIEYGTYRILYIRVL